MLFARDVHVSIDAERLRLQTVRDCDRTKRHQFRVDKENVDEEVLSFLSQRGMSITHGEVFHTPPKSLLPIHVDGPELNNLAKLNWCWGAAGAKMIWWRLKSGHEPELKITGIGTRYLTMAAENCVPVHSAKIGLPTLVNVGQPHSIFNMTTESRWVLSLVLTDLSGAPLMVDEALARLT